MSFQKAKAIFQKYFQLENEINTLETRVKIGNYANIIQKDFVTCDAGLLEYFVSEIIKHKKQELQTLEKDYEWINLKVNP